MAEPNSETLVIGKADISDLNDIVPLFEGYRQFYEQQADLQGCRNFIEARLKEKDSIIVIARDRGRAVGFVQLYPSYSSVAMRRIWILNDLFVLPDARNKGVAKRLLDHAERIAIESCAIRLTLATAANNTKARTLYESSGWEQEVVFVQYKRTL
jgi:GNAT superfamily N-acetyltransferase